MELIKKDPSSSANLEDYICTFLDLDLAVDFDKQQLSGFASLTLKSRKSSPASSIVLDGRDLQITSIICQNTKSDLKFSIEKISAELGEKITVALGAPEQTHAQQSSDITIVIHYSTSSAASGLQWLPPAQTEGKKFWYMFSQFQAIHARSVIPCQDSPGAKCAYAARLEVPKDLVALMSAPPSSNSKEGRFPETHQVYSFSQKLPTPSYLIAFVVGKLERRELSKRCAVYSEKERIEECVFEFEETEKFLSTAENYLSEYAWGRYDLLVLPSSFPYGGMENPTLTFVTPTLLAGDRSLANVVAHEIAHSWTGNLVTNVTWEHFWLNEGFTVFTERKILEKMYGIEAAHLSYLVGHQNLVESIESMRERKLEKYTSLVHDLSGGADPDDAFSSVPYERGSQFLFHLEHLVGATAFADFFREWVNTFQFKNVDSETFKKFFSTRFPEASAKVEWETWLFGTGLPPIAIQDSLNLSLANAALKLSQKWINNQGEGAMATDIQGWHNTCLVYFLEKLRSAGPMPLETTKKLGAIYGLTTSKNSEIRNLWAHIAIQSEHAEVFPQILEFITTQGRMKFVRPLYRALFKSQKGKQMALDTFKKNKSFYHPIAQKMISIDLELQ